MKHKYKIMKDRPEIADEEIRRYMDFDALLRKHAQGPPHPVRKGYAVAGVGAAIALCGLVWWYATRESSMVIPENSQHLTTATDSAVAEDPKRKDAAPTMTNVPEIKAERSPSSQAIAPAPARPDSGKATDIRPATVKEASEQQTSTPASEKLPAPEYVAAEPVDGFPELYAYFARELTYPQVTDSIDGVVVITFTINKLGGAEKVSIEESLGPEFDQEAIRLIEQMPPWKPATFSGMPVNSRLSIPITFKVQRIK